MLKLTMDSAITEVREVATKFGIKTGGKGKQFLLDAINAAMKADTGTKRRRITGYQSLIVELLKAGHRIVRREGEKGMIKGRHFFAVTAEDGTFFWTRRDTVTRLFSDNLITTDDNGHSFHAV